jgi:type IV secretory pathway VirB10-like protein
VAINEESLKPVDLESAPTDNEREQLLREAQVDKVVRGVNGSISPKVRRLRPLAGIIIIVIVVLAAAYMRHGMSVRHRKGKTLVDTVRVGMGPATTVEKSLLSDQTRNGLDTGQSHVPTSLAPRTSLLDTAWSQTSGQPDRGTSVPTINYHPDPVSAAANGALSFSEQQRAEEYKREMEAMEAPTSVKGSLPSESSNKPSVPATDLLQSIQAALLNARAVQGIPVGVPASLAGQDQRTDYDRQNDQGRKVDFGSLHAKEEDEYLGRERKAALGRFEIKAGWLIPAVLEQELNSDLPGLIRALVREDVYDSVSGRYVLIPAGSTLVGIYNSQVGYGQNALQAVWRRIIFPDGSCISIGGFEGDDGQGAAGFRDQVDSHWRRILCGALLTSLFAAGIQVSQGTNSSILQSQSVGQQVGQAVGQQIGQLGEEVTRRNLNVQPTIKVRPGYRFFVRVEKDILFNGAYSPMLPAQ